VRDLQALVSLVRLIRRYRPHILHTHTAKAGMLGRLAAVLAMRPRPRIVHTYHGHVLEGYFDPVRNAVFRGIERSLARVSDVLIGVSQATVDDLVRLRIADRAKFRVIPVGLDLARFADASPNGSGNGHVVLSWMGRMVPIKRVDFLLRSFKRACDENGDLRLDLVGDGELRPELEELARELGLGDRVNFAGHVTDVAPITARADVAVLSSANEGTPVALIEAAAAAKPAIATRVGGVPDVVVDGAGILVAPDDEAALASAMVQLASDAALRDRMGRCARNHVLQRFDSSRLVSDIEAAYERLLTSAG
jgi:glycosyltransferase involved in cell wall biosynthesis